jgi:hypothetical protein
MLLLLLLLLHLQLSCQGALRMPQRGQAQARSSSQDARCHAEW